VVVASFQQPGVGGNLGVVAFGFQQPDVVVDVELSPLSLDIGGAHLVGAFVGDGHHLGDRFGIVRRRAAGHVAIEEGHAGTSSSRVSGK
jgi:hypothetical protein